MNATIDCEDLMSLAWSFARQEHWSRRMPAGTLRSLFPAALKAAWAEMKRRAVMAAERAAEAARLAENGLGALRAELISLENTDRLGHEGMERLRAVQDAIRLAEEHDQRAKRDLIASAKGRICAVTFTKKDGSERTMKVQPAALKFHIKGDAATDAGRKGAVTRAARHPHLLPVWDVQKRAPRSVNLATVSRITVDGRTQEYA